MSLFIFIMIPLAWMVAGYLTGVAVAAAMFYSCAGKRWGRLAGNALMGLLPIVYLVLILAGSDGNGGRGFTLFESSTLFDFACAIPMYGVAALGIFAGAVYVIRDLTLGHNEASGLAAQPK